MITNSASNWAMRSAMSATIPVPNSVAGRGLVTETTRRSTISTPIASAKPAVSASDDAEVRCSADGVRSSGCRTTVSVGGGAGSLCIVTVGGNQDRRVTRQLQLSSVSGSNNCTGADGIIVEIACL